MNLKYYSNYWILRLTNRNKNAYKVIYENGKIIEKIIK